MVSPRPGRKSTTLVGSLVAWETGWSSVGKSEGLGSSFGGMAFQSCLDSQECLDDGWNRSTSTQPQPLLAHRADVHFQILLTALPNVRFRRSSPAGERLNGDLTLVKHPCPNAGPPTLFQASGVALAC